MGTFCTSPTPAMMNGGRSYIRYNPKPKTNLKLFWNWIWIWFIQARKLLPNGEEAGLGIVPSKQRWKQLGLIFADFAKPILRTFHWTFPVLFMMTPNSAFLNIWLVVRWERKMKMKNRKLVFGGQGGGHGRSSTSLDRWVAAKYKFYIGYHFLRGILAHLTLFEQHNYC